MKAHIVGGGLAGLTAAGHVLPTGRVFEPDYRCAFDLFSRIPAIGDPSVSIRDDILAFNGRFGIIDRTRLRDGRTIASWLERQGVTLRTGTRVVDVGFLPARERITATALTIESPGRTEAVAVAPEDIVLVTNGSQVEGLTIGSMSSAPPPTPDAETCALWRRLALGRPEFGSPQTFFGPSHIRDTAWVTFTVTETQPAFTNLMSALTASEPGRAGLITLAGSNWLLTLAIFHKPEFVGQPEAAC